MVKLLLKNLLASLLLLLFTVVILSLLFNVLSEAARMPATWEFIGVAALPLTAVFAICDYEEDK